MTEVDIRSATVGKYNQNIKTQDNVHKFNDSLLNYKIAK